MADATETLIATVEKNSTSEVRIRIATWRDCDFIDLRLFCEFDGTNGERRPSKRGLALGLHKLPELVRALQAAEAEARRRGLLKGGAP